MTTSPFPAGTRVLVSHETNTAEPGTVISDYDPGAGRLVTVRFDDRTRYVFPADKVRAA